MSYGREETSTVIHSSLTGCMSLREAQRSWDIPTGMRSKNSWHRQAETVLSSSDHGAHTLAREWHQKGDTTRHFRFNYINSRLNNSKGGSSKEACAHFWHKKKVVQWPALKNTSNIIQAEQIAVIYLGKHTKTKTVGSRPVGPNLFIVVA